MKVVDVDVDTTAASEGDERTVRARVELGGLDAGEVTVQALHGPIDSAGSFIGTPAAFTLRLTGDGAFEGTYTVGEAGPYGVTVRAIPQQRRPDQPDGDGPGRLGRVGPSPRLGPAEVGLARSVLEEAAHPDLAVDRVEDGFEQVPLQLQRCRHRLIEARVNRPLDHRLCLKRPEHTSAASARARSCNDSADTTSSTSPIRNASSALT